MQDVMHEGGSLNEGSEHLIDAVDNESQAENKTLL